MLYLYQLHDKVKDHSTFFKSPDDFANVANCTDWPNA